MEDGPEHLVLVVGLDRQAEEVRRIDPIPERRCRLIPGRGEAERDAAIRGIEVADDDAAGLVRVLAAGVLDEGLAEDLVDDDLSRARVAGRR
jgi:hypothetical protein